LLPTRVEEVTSALLSLPEFDSPPIYEPVHPSVDLKEWLVTKLVISSGEI
jgi:hypothetical protein